MEISGNNRYELLSMEDESVAPAIPLKQSAGSGKNKKDHSVQSNTVKNEKENKINTLNKNITKITNDNNGPKGNTISNGIRELRTKNVRMNGSEKIHSNLPEYNNDLPQRPIRDRESKAARFRGNEKFGKREFDRQSGSDKTGKYRLFFEG
ncbi:uncharacterized protein LOC115565560 [Drosophila navojoa]|uniref:uncharacterized protein LOC115565560 n=1 Tax=Drosophila navojoa TaxID=7232 RepID=UPI0011BE6E53|nr:uncharacterized protein LOC115565560 [Drosophila navojoa]